MQRPAYHVYRQVATLLSGAHLIGPLEGQAAGIEGYRFASGTRTITVFWSNSEQVAVIQALPGARVTCADRSGEPIVCDNTEGAVTLAAAAGPTYVIEY
jgi:hypothetical protein